MTDRIPILEAVRRSRTMNRPRLPRFVTVASPPPMVFTIRDREILQAVHAYRVLTREQIERLLFPPDAGQDHPTKTSICRKRLKLLFHHRYLDRIPAPVGPGRWAWRPVYRLAKKGTALLAVEHGVPVREFWYWGSSFDRGHHPTDVSLLFLEHALRMNDLRIAIALAAPPRGCRIERWLDDTELKRAEMKDRVHVDGLKVAVVPDAYFVLNLGDRRAHFLVELDRGTMSHRRWHRRILAYKAYMESGQYEERYETHSLRILTVTSSPERRAHLARTTQKAAGEKLSSRFWFATLDQTTPDQALSAPVWWVGGERVPRPLLA